MIPKGPAEYPPLLRLLYPWLSALDTLADAIVRRAELGVPPVHDPAGALEAIEAIRAYVPALTWALSEAEHTRVRLHLSQGGPVDTAVEGDSEKAGELAGMSHVLPSGDVVRIQRVEVLP